MQWIIFIVIGLICVLYPVMLFLYIGFFPAYVIVLFFVWLLLCVGSIAFFNTSKWYKKMIVTFISTFMFAIMLSYEASLSHDFMLYKNVAAMFLSPILSLPAIYFVGIKINACIENIKSKKKQEKLSKIENQINKIKKDINKIDNEINLQKRVVHIIDLVIICGTNITKLLDEKSVLETKSLILKKKQLEEEIINLRKEMGE